MSNVDALLNSALESHRAGRLDEARALYEKYLGYDPNHAGVLNLLGMAMRQLGRHAEAIERLGRAIAIEPGQAMYYVNLAEAHAGLGHADAAIEGYRQAARLAPQMAEIHSNLGVLLQRAGRMDEAAACYSRAIDCNPQHVQAHYNLANVFQLARDWERAIENYRRALALQPDFLEAHSDLGNALRESGRPEESLECLQKALAIQADFLPAVTNAGVALQDLGRWEEARRYFERALALAPERAEAHLNLGTLIADLGDPAAAIPYYDAALAVDPDLAQAHGCRGAALLTLGEFAEGLAGYEYRVRCGQFDTRDFPQPRWDGSPLAGRTLLVHWEQGLGDTLQFIRYLRRANEWGGKVVLDMQPHLIPLLQSSGFSNFAAPGGPLPAFDVHTPLMSLPYILKTRLESIPAEVPYLAAEPACIAQWRERLSAYPGLKIGIAWQGRPNYRYDRARSIALDHFAPLAEVEGVHLLSLQKYAGSEQLARASDKFAVVDLGRELDEKSGAFMDTAAVMASLDLMVTSDTAIAHLAGALGVRTWLALSRVNDWRWMLRREDSPWYPSMRLFRQRELGAWREVFERMAGELRGMRREA